MLFPNTYTVLFFKPFLFIKKGEKLLFKSLDNSNRLILLKLIHLSFRTCKLGSMVTSSNENKPHCRRDTCKKSETCFHTEIPDKYLSVSE